MEQTEIRGVLSNRSIRALIESDRPLVRDWLDLDAQLQPNGFDLTLQSISRHAGRGQVGQSNADRILSDLEPVEFDEAGWVELPHGVYHVAYNEVVALPLSVMAFGRPRSTLNRIGVTIHTAIWDAGYEGRSTSLLSVLNPGGVRLQQHSRVLQLVFVGVTDPPTTGYSGIYQHENLRG
jgi:dUTP pyrophosphatase